MKIRILKKDSEKKALISQLSNEKRTLMFFYEEVPGKDLRHERVSELITLVHPPYDYETLEKWLYLGNWQAIYPSNKDYKPFDTFRTKKPDIEQIIKEAKITLIIDSFHDDTEWNIIEEI
jgi:hypothetical protein